MHDRPPVGITMGDAAGIGPEIIVKACAQGLKAPAVVYGDAGAMQRAAGLLGARLDIREINSVSQASASPGRIEVITCAPPLPAHLP
ncbi:4-hydroxythreonine-4-phosphate dehydrogenase PdxA, partial [Bordetella petrii]|nr:4-hydroxythreonine-4-phosphate dehydrogenase PdxA [Bordetella petrii]